MIITSEIRATKLIGVFRCVTVMLGLGIAAASASAQMAIPGKFEVTPIGAASYTIPIQVPPGVAGMEPQLALNYNSRGGNGLMGIGWTLSGLPSITRCPRTTPQDGVKGAVAYDANDRFCLDGKRLMVVSGAYGAPGSSYRTEIDSFSNVTAFGSAGSGPQYFVVKTKDGQLMEFGNSVDSRVAVAGISTVRVWALNKIADAVGNTQSITYALPAPIASSTNEYSTYPQRIDYTSNSTTGLPATNHVEFAYVTRTDIINGYRGGYPVKTSVLLNSITTKTNGSVVSTYTPTYEAGAGGRSTITSISLCAAGGQLCAPQMRFGIGSVSGSFFPLPNSAILPVAHSETSVSGGKWIAMDVDGNGMADLVHLTKLSGVYRVWLSNGDGTFTIRESTTTADTNLQDGSWELLDVNGDGRPDLVHLTTTPGVVQVWTSNGDGSFTVTPFAYSGDAMSPRLDIYTETRDLWQVIDVNGDGLPDLVHFYQYFGGYPTGQCEVCYTTVYKSTSSSVHVWTSNGDGTFAITEFTDTSTATGHPYDGGPHGGFALQVLDVNGDGLADLVSVATGGSQFKTSTRMHVWKSKGDGTFSVEQINQSDTDNQANFVYGGWRQIDVNGDGLIDLLHFSQYPGENYVQVWISKGDGTFAKLPDGQVDSSASMTDGTWQVLDTNGDGLADLVHTPSNLATGKFWNWESRGDGTFTVTESIGQTVDICSSSCTDIRSGDFLGIGAPGFVRLDGNTVKSAWFLSKQPRNVVTSVADGVGGSTSWSLSPLPAMLRRGSYFKDIPSDSATWTLTVAIPVVETVNKSIVKWEREGTMTSLDRATWFSYGSARAERNGHGFIGFNWLQSKDSVTGLSTRTYFRQDFPYTGLAATKGTGSGGSWNNLSITNTIYGCTLLDGGSTCPVAAGNRYFVYPAEGNTRSWDLDGTALPGTAFVNSNPDRFGNLRNSASYILNPDGQPNADYSKRVTNTYYNDETNWITGRLVKTVVETTGPTVAAPAIPGSGGLPPAAAPTLPPQTTAALMAILQLLLGDD